MTTAVFPGSFDPVTKGHLDLINRASNLFDKLIVTIGTNTSKKSLFSSNKRAELLKQNLKDYKNVEVRIEDGLTVKFVKEMQADVIIRGLRNSNDFNYEKSIANMNHSLAPDIQTVFLIAKPNYEDISSSMLREIFHFGGDISKYVPENVIKELRKREEEK